MDLVDLITPALAVFAALVAIGLGVQAFRQGRHIRRLESRLESIGASGTAAPLERLAQLQQRMTTSSGGTGLSADTRTRLLRGLGIAVGVAVVAVGGWFAWQQLSGGDSGGSAGATTPTTPATATGKATTTTAAAPVAGVCTNVKPVDDPAAVTVSLFNASGVTGAALGTTWPKLQAAGYGQGAIINEPNGTADLAKSSVQYVKRADRPAACAVAKELGYNRVTPLDGYTADQVGGDAVNVLVVVGLDLANG